MSFQNCACTPEQAELMFKRAEQYIDDQIASRVYAMAKYWVDLYPVKSFVDGAGLSLQKMRFHGDIGPQYDGFDGWRKVQISRHGNALGGEHNACGYNWEEVGHGMETVEYDLMQRDLRTKKICVKDIRTFFQYQEVQNLIFQNLANISANMREQLNRNAAMLFQTKHLALPGLPVNVSNPHQFPQIPSGVQVGKLTYRLLLQLYHQLVQEAAGFALANINGAPAFGVIAHPETLHDMSYEDPEIRKDMRECDRTSCELISRYNFLDTFGPFVLMPDLYAPRYNRDSNGNLRRVFPFDRNLPIEIGTRAVTNPEYHSAEFEYVQILTKDLFTLRTRKALSSVGGATDFDSETAMFEWKWHNPPRDEDPYRRTGRYVTTAEIGVEPGDFTDIPGILVKRKPGHVGIQYWGVELCPPDPADCPAAVIPQTCPCPQVIGLQEAVADDEIVVIFDRDIGASVEDDIQVDTVNGAYLTGEVVEISSDGTRVRLKLAEAKSITPGYLTQLRCLDLAYCSAKVTKTELCDMLAGRVTFTVNKLLKAGLTDTVTLIFCNGETVDAPIHSMDTSSLEYTITLAFATYCDNKGVARICVPPATDASCPDCAEGVFEDCEVPVEEGEGGGEG